MSKFLKLTYSLVALVLLSILAFMVWFTGQQINLPRELEWVKFSYDLPEYWKTVGLQFLFWSALVFFVIVLLRTLVIIFKPRLYSEFELEDNKGSLLLQKSAVDGLVKSAITSQSFMKKPVVKTKMHKNKFSVKVSGEALRQSDILGKAKTLQKQIENDLSATLGLKQDVDFKIKVKAVEVADKKKSKTSRVE